MSLIKLRIFDLFPGIPQLIATRNISYCEDLLRFYSKVNPLSELLRDFQVVQARYYITSMVPENQV